MSLKTPEKLRKLQRALYAKAKEEPQYRFYLLYDKVYRRDILEFAYRKCKANGGAPGVDGESFEEIEAYGRERWLRERAEELQTRGYRADAVCRVWIEKENGGQRPLGIPTIRDRVVQMAVVLVIEPIFEADFEPEQYGYRPGRSALGAIRKVHEHLNTGHREVVDADLSGYFDTIPHGALLKSVARRISDKHLLKLIKGWLKAPTQERRGPGAGRGQTRRTGTPQGSPLSPLLANVYIRRLIVAWKRLGFEHQLQARMVNYADDLVICCRRDADAALRALKQLVERLQLSLNERKTQIRRVPDESFDFLGYTLGRCYSRQTGKSYLGTRPSKLRITRICGEISAATSSRWLLLEPERIVDQLNRKLGGWSNYFCLGPVSKAYRVVDSHTRYRLRRWLRKKHKVQSQGTARFPDEYLYDRLQLVRLESRTRNLPWANA
jgi:group II intron reverse transcriptase/maturase